MMFRVWPMIAATNAAMRSHASGSKVASTRLGNPPHRRRRRPRRGPCIRLRRPSALTRAMPVTVSDRRLHSGSTSSYSVITPQREHHAAILSDASSSSRRRMRFVGLTAIGRASSLAPCTRPAKRESGCGAMQRSSVCSMITSRTWRILAMPIVRPPRATPAHPVDSSCRNSPHGSAVTRSPP
jgi:hypothetical protein